MKSISIALIIAAAAGFSAAHASPFDAPQTRIVRYSDLDVDSSRGAEVLYRRIVIAARAVCGESESPDPWVLSGSYRSCVAKAVDSSVQSVDRAALTAYHERNKSALRLVLRSPR